MTVAVRTGEEGSGFNGISFLLIERDMPGVSKYNFSLMEFT
jgi:alkylation response protein AidB-like acyl-CoA dehydrogenase